MSTATLLLRHAVEPIRVRAVLRGGRTPVLVLTYGKTGSSTIAASVEAAAPTVPCFHLHWITAPGVAEARRAHGYPGPVQLSTGTVLRRWLRRHPARPVTVITSVREPVARAVSDLRENAHRTAPSTLDGEGRLRVDGALEELHDRLRDDSGTAWATWWLEAELAAVTGIDVFDLPFDPQRGWMHASRGRVDLYLVRMEDLDRVGPAVLGEALGHPGPVELVDRNVADVAADAGSYRALKGRLVLSADTIERIYGSRFVRTFYPDVRDELAARWADA